MKFIGFLLALAVLAGIIFLLGYGLFEAWTYLAHQWSLVDASWKPVVILLSSVMIVCSFLIIWFIQSGLRRSFYISPGKHSAYGHFMHWYIEADNNNYASADIQAVAQMRPEFLLWASNNVLKQFNNLSNELSAENPNTDTIRKYANNIYIEIQRELGRRAGAAIRQI